MDKASFHLLDGGAYDRDGIAMFILARIRLFFPLHLDSGLLSVWQRADNDVGQRLVGEAGREEKFDNEGRETFIPKPKAVALVA